MSQTMNEENTIHKTNSDSVSSMSSQESQSKITLEINTTTSVDTSEETAIVSPLQKNVRNMCYLPASWSPKSIDISGNENNEETALQ
uniref:Uncharacterized protein n=1 Tax=viral metagenome TaxID=1070528 RepID=A0A6C0CK87_9ZZZZ